MQLARDEDQVLPSAWIGERREWPRHRVHIRRIEVDIGQRQQDRYKDKRCCVQKQVVAPDQPIEDLWPLQCDQTQQRVRIMDRIETLEDDTGGRANTEREQHAMFDQWTK